MASAVLGVEALGCVPRVLCGAPAETCASRRSRAALAGGETGAWQQSASRRLLSNLCGKWQVPPAPPVLPSLVTLHVL